jgi:hypothetical protein
MWHIGPWVQFAILLLPILFTFVSRRLSTAYLVESSSLNLAQTFFAFAPLIIALIGALLQSTVDNERAGHRDPNYDDMPMPMPMPSGNYSRGNYSGT